MLQVAEEGQTISITLQTMERVGKNRRESINTESWVLRAKSGARAVVGYWNGFEVTVDGAERV